MLQKVVEREPFKIGGRELWPFKMRKEGEHWKLCTSPPTKWPYVLAHDTFWEGGGKIFPVAASILCRWLNQERKKPRKVIYGHAQTKITSLLGYGEHIHQMTTLSQDREVTALSQHVLLTAHRQRYSQHVLFTAHRQRYSQHVLFTAHRQRYSQHVTYST